MRPAKLTEEIEARIVTLIRNGNYRTTACQAAGIGTSTFYRWMEQGEADDQEDLDTPLRAFYLAVRRAEAESEATDIAIIETAARQGDWKAAAWRVERKVPQHWNLKQVMEVEHSGGIRREPIEMPTDDDTLRQLAEIAKSVGLIGDDDPHGDDHH